MKQTKKRSVKTKTKINFLPLICACIFFLFVSCSSFNRSQPTPTPDSEINLIPILTPTPTATITPEISMVAETTELPDQPTMPSGVENGTYSTPESNGFSTLPEYTGSPFVYINGNIPFFSDAEKTDSNNEFELYSNLDGLGRCGVAFAIIDINTMPSEERGSIGMIQPSGWHTYRFDDIISDKYLYNRCHLIGFQLAGENANELNLITGTRYLNVSGMLPFENEVADYVEDYNGKVLYRVTPIFVGNELVARGVLMEAYSLTDGGSGVCFNVYCFNVQPGIQINYETGEAWAETQTK